MMNFYTISPFLKWLLNKNIWATQNNKILLTFDDGPVSNNTIKILNWLKEKKIKALFFCVGNNIINNESIVKEIIASGHSIGNHTYNHKQIFNLSKRQIFDELIPVNNLMKEKFNYDIKYFRPPHGKLGINSSQTFKELGLNCIMWSLLTYDFKNDINIVKFAIENKMKSDSIVVFHDNLKSSNIIIESLDYFYKIVQKKGFEIGVPEECLK